MDEIFLYRFIVKPEMSGQLRSSMSSICFGIITYMSSFKKKSNCGQAVRRDIRLAQQHKNSERFERNAEINRK